jgi:hypothetical protein
MSEEVVTDFFVKMIAISLFTVYLLLFITEQRQRREAHLTCRPEHVKHTMQPTGVVL